MVPAAADVPAPISFAAVGVGEVVTQTGPKLDLREMMSWVRHSKNSKLKVRNQQQTEDAVMMTHGRWG
jgi:hypothetical protein